VNYFDSSAIVKLFIVEPGTQRVHELFASDREFAVSRVGYAEVHAGFARRRRDGSLDSNAYEKIVQLFDAQWLLCARIDLRDDVLAMTRALVRRHPLRGFDAIHLASAITLKPHVGEGIQFVASDDRLLAAAQAEGLSIVDVRR
jgi:uncharacterized protein